MKLESFKEFVRNNPYLVNYVKNDKMTWQKFYEIFDLYGPDDSIWNDFKDNNSNSNNPFKDIVNLIKGIDLNSVRNALTSIDKAIETFKNFNNNETNEIYQERPKNKFYED